MIKQQYKHNYIVKDHDNKLYLKHNPSDNDSEL